MADRKKEGISKLAKTLDKRINEHSETGLTFDFGVIKKGLYLQPNTMNVKISKNDYSVLEYLTGQSTGTALNGTGYDHSHKWPKLKAGDHVVFIWVQEEPVILGVIKKGSAI